MREIILKVKGGKVNENEIRKKIEGVENLEKILEEIKEKVKEFEGVEVEVRVYVNGNYYIKFKFPSVGELVRSILGVEKLKVSEEDKAKGVEVVGDVSMKDIEKIARMKMIETSCDDLKKMIRQVVGSCVSMPITIEGKKPKEVLEELK